MMYGLLIGNIICAIGTCLLFRKVFKNRKLLKDFDFTGSLLTFAACVAFAISFMLELRDYLSMFFSLITVSFWFLVIISNMRGENK